MSTVPVMAEIVDGAALLEVVWTSVLAGLGVTALFGVAIVGATRAVDHRREGRAAQSLLFGALGALALAVVGAAVVFGIVQMAA